MWLAVHLVYITGFKNRVTALLHWAISFLGRGRSERTTTEQQIFARSALARLKRGATDLVSDPGEYDAAREADRRAALEAQALEEARLTDCRPPRRTRRPPLSTARWRAAYSKRSWRCFSHRLARPLRQDEDALGLHGDPFRCR